MKYHNTNKLCIFTTHNPTTQGLVCTITIHFLFTQEVHPIKIITIHTIYMLLQGVDKLYTIIKYKLIVVGTKNDVCSSQHTHQLYLQTIYTTS